MNRASFSLLSSTALALAGLALTTSARADVHTHRVWVPGPTGWALAHVDLNDATGAVDVWADYSGLSADLIEVTLELDNGTVLVDLDHVGGQAGFAHGSGTVASAAQQALFAGDASIVFRTVALPSGEMSAVVDMPSFLGREFPLEGEQVAPGLDTPGSGTGFAFGEANGVVSFSGYIFDVANVILAAEVRGPAYFGADGPVLLDLDLSPGNGSNTNFFEDWTPTPQEFQDLKDGLLYLLVRTDAFPAGELRGQITSTVLGNAYCEARPNSVGFNGAGLWATGSVLAADASVELHGGLMPVGKPVLPIVGVASGHAFEFLGSPGTLCIAGGPAGRLSGSFGFVGPAGGFSTTLDLDGFPLGGVPTMLTPGQVLHFQLWYRDTDEFGLPSSNLSNAVQIRFR